MQPIEDFMQQFFAEKVKTNRAWVEHWSSFDQKYYAPDWIERRERGFLLSSPPEVVEHVTQSEISAEVITSGYHFRSTQHRQRYHLVAAGESWQIRSIDMECGICHATGKTKTGGAPCPVCKGKGWISGDDAA
jgi:hypothetical protein